MKSLNIIPTPQYIDATSAEGLAPCSRIQTVCIPAQLKPAIEAALALLPPLKEAAKEQADLLLSFAPADEPWFQNPNAEEQGYILKGMADGRILLSARHPMGFMYGLMTLLQLPAVENEFEIKDYPDIRYRGNKWLIWNETEIWSYDFGDGPEAFKERIRRKLDLCLRFKINMVFFDGTGVDPDRTPDYKSLMLECNREARKRGIHLVTSSYTMGYGLAAHPIGKYYGKAYQNIKNGKVYDCLGTYIVRSSGEIVTKARHCGTCLSNDAMMTEKLEELCRYIKEVEPGGLYLHNMDSCRIHPDLWKARCADCRRRWPNDDLYAPDGMAGAFAAFFDRLNGALQTVETANYSAARDLLIFNVSPGYMEYTIDDEAVQVAADFWSAVQRYAKVNNNVYPLFRELHYNMNDHRLRVPEVVAKAVPRFGILNFCGGDGFYSDQLFLTPSRLMWMFKGAEVVFSDSGNAFQEPLQLFNAQYMWNLAGDPCYSPANPPEGYKPFMEFFLPARLGKDRPEEIYGEGGLLDILCEKLYGPHAPAMARFFKLFGESGECPVPYPCNKETMTGGNKVLLPYRWDNELPEEEIQHLIGRFSEILRLNNEGIAIMSAEKTEDPDLLAYQYFLTLNTELVALWLEYLLLYRDADAALRKGEGEKSALNDRVQELQRKVQAEIEHHKTLNYHPVDPMGGALSRRKNLLDTLRYNTELIRRSLATDQRIPDDRDELEDENWW